MLLLPAIIDRNRRFFRRPRSTSRLSTNKIRIEFEQSLILIQRVKLKNQPKYSTLTRARISGALEAILSQDYSCNASSLDARSVAPTRHPPDRAPPLSLGGVLF